MFPLIFLFRLFIATYCESSSFLPVQISAPNVIPKKISHETSEYLEAICGRPPPFVRQKNGSSQDYPWAVSVMVKGRNKLGGVIISPYHILTAAHPFIKSNTLFGDTPCNNQSRYRTISELQERVVVYGGKCIRGKHKTLPNHTLCDKSDVAHNSIRLVLVDGGFLQNNCRKGHDWAVIEVRNPIRFGTFTRPICLPEISQAIQRKLMVFGWGRKNVFFEADPYIREIPMLHDAFCSPPWSDKMPTDVDDYICTVAVSPTDYTTPRTCYGDSGSGMEQRDKTGKATLIGITSFGSKGCPPNELARFTRVDRYLEPICAFTGVCYTVYNHYLLMNNIGHH
ncbi:hypothetical protein AB6A40_002695 [Gnathostoma spinigerum]|uniref:Peptidase S1 domain-containing protein n=1 Tax=Gnathostoma spinigerum TaxID=75299 RepID=A0ABD6EF00_9BILA